MRIRDNPPLEGVTLGLSVATVIWIWITAIDLFARRPLHTFDVLGGVVVFTIVHYALNVLYGVILVSALRAARRAPSLVIAVIFGVVMMQITFVMATIILSNTGLGQLSWPLILGGSLIGTAVAGFILNRRYPIVAQLARAEAER